MRALLFCSFLLACGHSTDSADAAPDVASSDAGRDVAVRDGGPVCAPQCGAAQGCCLVDGAPQCVELRNDDAHCGGCGIQCGLEYGLGEFCERRRCRCGDVEIGCRGDRSSWCCPARRADLHAYCADLERDYTDCGSCGASCDPARADRCEGGRCRCGRSADACDGTRQSTCCPGFAGLGASCVDLDTDREHCGACDVRCPFNERCVAGVCVGVSGGDAGGDGVGTDAGAEGSADAGRPAGDGGA